MNDVPDVVLGQIMTASGALVAPYAMRPTDIRIEDIARALSNICRYAGQINRFYSVAQHSVLVSEIVPPRLRLEAMLHDAAEAYLGDLPAPIKRLPNFLFYREAEHHIEALVRDVFRLSQDTKDWEQISKIDKALRVNEREALGLPHVARGVPIEGVHISLWTPERSFANFAQAITPLMAERSLPTPKGWW